LNSKTFDGKPLIKRFSDNFSFIIVSEYFNSYSEEFANKRDLTVSKSNPGKNVGIAMIQRSKRQDSEDFFWRHSSLEDPTHCVMMQSLTMNNPLFNVLITVHYSKLKSQFSR
jgi:hypothetical protein